MNAFREIAVAHPEIWLSAGGLLIGIVFGAVGHRTNFCTMGALSDVINLADYRRLRGWLLAISVALLGTHLVDAAGITPIGQSMYLTPTLNWLGNTAGGLMFGYGMVLAGGCASRNLIRAGAGDLRALMVLIIVGIAAYMTIGGILGPGRAWLEQVMQLDLAKHQLRSQGLGEVAARAFAVPSRTLTWAIAGIIGSALLAYCFVSPSFRRSGAHITGGVIVGLCVVAGWIVTGLALDDLAARPTAPTSLSFVRPTGDTLEWLQRFTALGWPGFGVSTVFGVLIGAGVSAAATGRFRVLSFSDVGDAQRTLAGGALMGVGGVLALGCTIGQAITGVSTLAIGSLLALAGIVAGGIAGLKALERRLMAEP